MCLASESPASQLQNNRVQYSQSLRPCLTVLRRPREDLRVDVGREFPVRRLTNPPKHRLLATPAERITHRPVRKCGRADPCSKIAISWMASRTTQLWHAGLPMEHTTASLLFGMRFVTS